MKHMSDNLQSRIKNLMISYYTDYYQKTLGLPDYKKRIESRLREEESHADHITKLEDLLNCKFDSSKRILIVGGGTGAEFIYFSRRGCETYTLEPNIKALEIIKLKAKSEGLVSDRIRADLAEKISFEDCYFDFVYCFTVLEHVSDVGKAINEMIRVTKKGGNLYIVCPDYRHLYEPHYKTFLPLWFPRWAVKLVLMMKGRPPGFFYTLQLVTANQLRNSFRNSNVISMQICFPYSSEWENPKGWNRVTQFLQDRFGISRDQHWFLKKV